MQKSEFIQAIKYAKENSALDQYLNVLFIVFGSTRSCEVWQDEKYTYSKLMDIFHDIIVVFKNGEDFTEQFVIRM